MAKIAIVKGNDRKENIKRAIQFIEKDIEKAIKQKKSKQLFIKINTVDINFPLACTHIDALEQVLDIFYKKFDSVIIGDNSFAFTKNKGKAYKQVLKKFLKVKFSDLTEFESENIRFETLNGSRFGKISLLPKKAFTISLALPKTHDTFVYTGCLKNMFGCVIKGRGHLHALRFYENLFLNKYVKGNRKKWQNLINVINITKPDLSILDGYEGMEGDGPIFGKKVNLRIAMCSLDGIALDKLASKICGMNNVPYLDMFPTSQNIEIIKEGFNNLNELYRKFKLHYNHKYQIKTTGSLIPLIDIKFALSVFKNLNNLQDKIKDKILNKFI